MRMALREVVRAFVEEFLEEATYRQKYVDDVYNVLTGALGEYYKARWAEANGDPDPSLRMHWDREVDNHFEYRFTKLVQRLPKGTYDRRKAFEEAMKDVERVAPVELKNSGGVYAKDFGLKFKDLEYPPDAVTDEFMARCWNEFEARAWRPRT